MKLILLFLFLPLTGSSQNINIKQAEKLSREIIKVIKNNSVYKDQLDYDDIEKDFLTHIDTFTTYEKVGRYYTIIMRMAGDNHSFYANEKMLSNYSKKQKENLNISYKLLQDNIGYISIPGFLSTDVNIIDSFANVINDAIRQLDEKDTITGWIIDLRTNNGGNMWPMVTVLSSLIGVDEVPGYFQSANKSSAVPWSVTGKATGITLKHPHTVKNKNAKIAVLYGNNTASSGEMTAIAFIGKPNSRSFGSNTAGLTTANSIFNLSHGNIFVLASSYCLDRNKKIYKDKITPDVIVNTNDNELLTKAIAWINAD